MKRECTVLIAAIFVALAQLLGIGHAEERRSLADMALSAEPISRQAMSFLAQATSDCHFLEGRRRSTSVINALGALLLRTDIDANWREQCFDALFDRVGIDVSAEGLAELTDAVLVREGSPQRYGSFDNLSGTRFDVDSLPIVDTERSRLGLPSLTTRAKQVAALASSGAWFKFGIPPLAKFPPSYPNNDRLRAQLMRMVIADQQARSDAWRKLGLGASQSAVMKKVDAKNLPSLRHIIGEFGFPDASEIGRSGVAALWLLLQHADDKPLMRRGLALAKPLVAKGDLPPVYFALLTDRVRSFSGQCQVYGTQSWVGPSGPLLYPVEDVANVNIRRKLMRMGPLKGNIATRMQAPPGIKVHCT